MVCASTSRRMSPTVDHAGMPVPQARAVRMAPVSLPVPASGAPVVGTVSAVLRAFVLTGSAVPGRGTAVTRPMTVVILLKIVALAAFVHFAFDSRQREGALEPGLLSAATCLRQGQREQLRCAAPRVHEWARGSAGRADAHGL